MKSKTLFLALLLALFLSITIFSSSDSFAQIDRIRTCTPEAGGDLPDGDDVTVGRLEFTPFTSKDFTIELERPNPTCVSAMTAAYALVKFAIDAMNKECATGDKTSKYPNPFLDGLSVVKATKNAGQANCQGALAGVTLANGAWLATAGIIHSLAQDAFDNSSLCGSDWRGWNPKTMFKDIPKREYIVDTVATALIANGEINGIKIDDPFKVKEYRESINRGVEFEDNDQPSSEACVDVTRVFSAAYGDIESIDKDYGDSGSINKNIISHPRQKYYFRGTEMANYGCEKYRVRSGMNDPILGDAMSKKRKDAYDEAYKCCIKKSQERVCVKFHDEYKLCKGGGFCTISAKTDIHRVAIFETKYKMNKQLICVSSYGFCPYNFYLGGGTERCDYFRDGTVYEGVFTPIDQKLIKEKKCANNKSQIRDPDCTINNKAGRCKNYCQQLNHCTIVANIKTHYETSITSPYASNACLDFVGDSANQNSYNTGIIAGNQKHFTAPIAQCVRETIANIFFNNAGHTKCKIPGEIPDLNGNCKTQLYIYKKNEDVSIYQPGYTSFFVTLQNRLKDVIKIFLTVAITVTGVKTLLGGGSMKRADLVMFVVKMSLIAYFAIGNAWQSTFFNGVYKASEVVSTVIMRIGVSDVPTKRDGCQFGKIYNTKTQQTTIASSYPIGSEYLAVWDTFDCKIARYLGYGPGASVANLFSLVLAGFLTGAVGIYFSAMLLIFGIFMLIAALRALHIFLTSAISIVLMVYVSPLVISLSLFAKTEGIFKKWLSNLISFSLQPIILMAYIGLFVIVFDQIILGSAEFTGDAPNKDIKCKAYCMKAGGVREDAPEGVCNDEGVIVNPKNDSVACIVNFGKYGSWPGLEMFGIILPNVADIFKTGAKEKIFTLSRAALVIYILANFLDSVPGMASSLTGGAGMPKEDLSAKKMFNKTRGIMSAIQKRGARGIKKHAPGIGKGAVGAARHLGNKGKGTGDPGDGAGGSSPG